MAPSYLRAATRALFLFALCLSACDTRGFVVGSPAPPVLVISEPPSRLSEPRVLPGAQADILATSITPITSIAGGASGFSYSGDSYSVRCTVSGTVTLYPAVHDGTSWTVYQPFPCSLDSAIDANATCIFPAAQGTGLTWNAFKTGSGIVSSCSASPRNGPAPSSKAPPQSGPGSGTVTSVGLALPTAEFTVTGSPVTTSGTLTGTWKTQDPNVFFAGPTSGGATTPAFRALVSADLPPPFNTLTLPLSKANGGFGQSVASGLTNDYVAIVSGGAITIGPLSSAALPFTLPLSVANGGTGNSAGSNLVPVASTAGRIVYDNGTAWTALAAGTSSQILRGNGAAAPVWVSTLSSFSINAITNGISWTGFNDNQMSITNSRTNAGGNVAVNINNTTTLDQLNSGILQVQNNGTTMFRVGNCSIAGVCSQSHYPLADATYDLGNNSGLAWRNLTLSGAINGKYTIAGTPTLNTNIAIAGTRSIGSAAAPLDTFFVRNPIAQVIGSNIASAGTIAPIRAITHITGTTAIDTITPPTACAATTGCTITLIPDGLWTWTTAGNIALAGSAVVSKAVAFTYDPGTSKWYPSYN